jgi:hypothetical protein
MKECFLQNKYLKEINFGELKIDLLNVKTLMFNYTLIKFDIDPKNSWIENIISRNKNLHHFNFYNFHFHDFHFLFQNTREKRCRDEAFN